MNMRWIIAAAFLTMPVYVFGYSVPTHEVLTGAAVSGASLNDDFLKDLGLTSLEQEFPNSEGSLLSIKELFQFGAHHEDRILFDFRSLNHFFDIQHDGRGLSVAPLPRGEPSPDWILEGQGQSSREELSYRKAQEHFLQALGAPAKADRERSWGRSFQNLGHVVHHIHDMAQPEHVRNDAHPDLFGEGWYERYTNSNDGRASWTPLLGQAGDPVLFGTRGAYWENPQGTGIAQFTSLNFVSKDTNFGTDRYPSPAFGDAVGHDVNADVLFRASGIEDRLPNECRAPNPPCVMTFLTTHVTDHYRPEASAANPRASTLSIFDQYLQPHGRRLFALNRFNFNAAYEFLVPRAVSYSAGLINHFFRGRMEFIGAEVEGDQVRIEIKNVSDGGNAFGPGTFTMYYESTDGTRKPLAISAGASLGGVQLAPQASYFLTIPLPGDVDLVGSPGIVNKPFVLVYDGQIGQERGVAGIVFAVDAWRGFLITPYLPPYNGVGVGGTRLMYKSNGQWGLHPQSGFAGENIDWKGQYVNGKPTKVLSWKGPSSRYFHNTFLAWRARTSFRPDLVLGAFDSAVYQGGRKYSVAPAKVLGAAIRRDSTGKEWIVVICNSGPGDTIYTRPNTYSLSSALYDPVTDPDGWRNVAFFPNPPSTEIADRAWHFNGDGTEAQTMRRLTSSDAFLNQQDLTRLKITVGENSAAMSDLGGTYVTRRTMGTQTRTCYSGEAFGPLEIRKQTITNGESVVAVDYSDSEEVMAYLKVYDEEEISVSGSGGEDLYHPHVTETVNLTRDRKLRIGSSTIEIEKSTRQYELAADVERLSSQDQYFENYAWLFALDLRVGTVAYRRAVVSQTVSRAAGADSGTQHTERASTVDLSQFNDGALTEFYEGSSSSVSDQDFSRTFVELEQMRCDEESGTFDLTGELVYTGDRKEWASMPPDFEVPASGALATDRDGNFVISFRFHNEHGGLSKGSYFSDGDLFGVMGIPANQDIFQISVD